jgi:hypothetical protein
VPTGDVMARIRLDAVARPSATGAGIRAATWPCHPPPGRLCRKCKSAARRRPKLPGREAESLRCLWRPTRHSPLHRRVSATPAIPADGGAVSYAGHAQVVEVRLHSTGSAGDAHREGRRGGETCEVPGHGALLLLGAGDVGALSASEELAIPVVAYLEQGVAGLGSEEPGQRERLARLDPVALAERRHVVRTAITPSTTYSAMSCHPQSVALGEQGGSQAREPQLRSPVHRNRHAGRSFRSGSPCPERHQGGLKRRGRRVKGTLGSR